RGGRPGLLILGGELLGGRLVFGSRRPFLGGGRRVSGSAAAGLAGLGRFPARQHVGGGRSGRERERGDADGGGYQGPPGAQASQPGGRGGGVGNAAPAVRFGH